MPTEPGAMRGARRAGPCPQAGICLHTPEQASPVLGSRSIRSYATPARALLVTPLRPRVKRQFVIPRAGRAAVGTAPCCLLAPCVRPHAAGCSTTARTSLSL